MANLNNISSILSSQIEDIMREWGEKTVNDIKRILMNPRKRINTARLINSIRYEIVKDRFAIIMNDYGKFVDWGFQGKQTGLHAGWKPKMTGFVKQQTGGGLLRLTPIKKTAFFYYTTPQQPISGKPFNEALDEWILRKLGPQRFKFRYLIKSKIWRFGIAPRPFIFKVSDNYEKALLDVKKKVTFGIKITTKK